MLLEAHSTNDIQQLHLIVEKKKEKKKEKKETLFIINLGKKTERKGKLSHLPQNM